MTKLTLIDDNRCFACGMDNPAGLRITWTTSEKTATAQFAPDQKYQGWKGVVHGGIIATLLDEAMTRLVCLTYGNAVTAEMTVRYVAPAEVGKLLDIHGEITNERRKLIEMKASIHCAGKLIAYATGKALLLR